MKKNFFKFFLVALLSVLGVSNAFAAEQKLTFDSTNGSTGNEGAQNLFDGNKVTKWYQNGSVTGKYVIFHADNPIVLKWYKLVNANDTYIQTDRSWQSWNLYGSSTSDGEWTLLQKMDGHLVSYEYQEQYYYLKSNTQAFQYYKIEITSARSGDVAQMADIMFYDEYECPTEGQPTTERPTKMACSGAGEIYKLIDESGTSTKWYTTGFIGNNVLIMRTTQPIQLTSQEFWSGDDTKTVPNRQLKGWDMYGSNDGINWDLVFRTSNDSTSLENQASTVHPVSNVQRGYMYYKFVATQSGNDQEIQMSDLKLTGTIAAQKCQIIYDANGGSGSTGATSIYGAGGVIAAHTLTAPNDQPAFIGWNTEKDGSGTMYQEGDIYKVTSSTPVEDTLYAQWRTPCTITYDANGGGGTMTSQVLYKSEVLKANTFTTPKDSLLFIGWNTAKDGLGEFYPNNSIFTLTASTPDNVTLYAQWGSKTAYESLQNELLLTKESLNGNCVRGTNETPDQMKSDNGGYVYLDAYAYMYSNTCTAMESGELHYGMDSAVSIPNDFGINVPFQFDWKGTGQYDGMDAIHLRKNHKSQTVTLAKPGTYEQLYFCATAAGIAQPLQMDVTITYKDNTTASRKFTILDWCLSQGVSNQTDKYKRYHINSGSYGKVYLYCMGLNSLLRSDVEVKALTFSADISDACGIAVFAITGQKCAFAPKEPTDTACYMTKNTTVISFDSVSYNKVDQHISNVQYEYHISYKEDFSDTVAVGDLNFVKEGERIIGTINKNYSGRYIRVRAKKNSYYSDYVPVPYKHKVTILPYSNGTVVLNPTSADNIYASGTDIKLTATGNTSYSFEKWEVNSDTTITTNPYTIDSITYDWTVQPVFSLSDVTVTYKPNGGILSGAGSKGVTIGQAYGELPVPTREKYNFQGWYTDSIGGKVVTKDTIVTQTTNHYLWAHWTEEKVGDGSDEPDVTTAQTKVKNTLQSWKEECGSTKAINLTIVRTIYKDGYYNTLCLPFNLTAAQIEETFGEKPKELKQYVSATVTGDETNRTIEITLKDTSDIACGKAYLISFANSGNHLTQLDFKDVIVLDTTAAKAIKSGDISYQGIFAPYQLDYDNKNLLFLGDNNKLYWPKNDGTFMKGFRAYFDVTTSQQAPTSPYKRGMKAAFGDKKTPTSVHDAQCTMHEIQKLVEQGRVVIITNGKKYDLQGNLLD